MPPPNTPLLDITYLFLDRRKLPVVDSDGRVVGQVSRRDILRAIDSAKDNPFLYGVKEQRPREAGGVHSAMERAPRQVVKDALTRTRTWSLMCRVQPAARPMTRTH